jgi:hypothetical protein
VVFFVVDWVFSSVVFFLVDFLRVFSPLVVINHSTRWRGGVLSGRGLLA